jgi:hypothetical protein
MSKLVRPLPQPPRSRRWAATRAYGAVALSLLAAVCVSWPAGPLTLWRLEVFGDSLCAEQAAVVDRSRPRAEVRAEQRVLSWGSIWEERAGASVRIPKDAAATHQRLMARARITQLVDITNDFDTSPDPDEPSDSDVGVLGSDYYTIPVKGSYYDSPDYPGCDVAAGCKGVLAPARILLLHAMAVALPVCG